MQKLRPMLPGFPLCGLMLLLMAVILQTALPAFAAEPPGNVKVLVMPIKINAQQELSYLSNQIASVLAEKLTKEGATAITVKADETKAALQAVDGGLDQILKKAAANQATQVIWGSFTLFDQSFSLDIRLMAVKDHASPQRFFAQGQRLDELITVTNDLADQIGLKLFRRQIVTAVRIQGNQRIEADAILRVIKTQKGSIYKPATLSQDLKSIFNMGYFDDVRVEAQPDAGGQAVIFHVKEKPTVRRIIIKGNSFIDEEDIRDNLTISTGAILNIFKIRSNIDQIEALYKEKNYHKVKVDYKIHPLDNNQADLEFDITEGPKVYVTEIRFEGNKAFSEKTLKKQLKVKEKGFFYWLTDSGDLDRAELDQDVGRLNEFYSNRGYINAKIGDPEVTILDEGIHITIKIDEGKQYKIGKVDITGDLILPKDELLKTLSITQETYFSREKLRNDVLAITDIYADRGYAYADVSPRTAQDQETLTVDITFDIKKHDLVYFEKIIIAGNTRTRDKVIRRELRVKEQGLFSSKALKRSIRNLYTLEYFEDIKVDTLKGSTDDKMTLKIDVTEKATGSFSFGAGYSSEENVFFTGSITERNLFGRGQTLDLTGTVGSRTTNFVLSFTEPYLFDTKLRTTASAYNQIKDYDTYLRKSYGGGVRFGYPVWDFTRFYWGYSLDFSDITIDSIKDENGNETGEPVEVPDSIQELVGIGNTSKTNITSSANLSLVYDSRDKSFNATEGSKHSLYMEYAGLGGDIGFNKYIAQTMWYFPLLKPFIGFFNAKIGFVYQNSGKLLPDYEKFYLGGITSLRGFGYRGVHLINENQNGEQLEVGGDKMVQFNFEIIFPITPEAGVNGVVFYDMGNVYGEGIDKDGNPVTNSDIDFSNMRQSAGVGIRWLTPIAPLRLEYGWILDQREGEQSGQIEFSLGGSF